MSKISGIKQDGATTTQSYEGGGESTLHHVNEEAAKAYASSGVGKEAPAPDKGKPKGEAAVPARAKAGLPAGGISATHGPATGLKVGDKV